MSSERRGVEPELRDPLWSDDDSEQTPVETGGFTTTDLAAELMVLPDTPDTFGACQKIAEADPEAAYADIQRHWLRD